MLRLWIALLVEMTALLSGCSQSQPVAGTPQTIRIMTYNIHHGEGMDKKLDLERIAAVIRRESPDLVALQEVDNGVKRSNGIDEPARLGELTHMQAVFGGNIKLQGGDYGNAVLSRWPITMHRNRLLPRVGNNEQRGALEACVRTPNGPLVFIAVHLDQQKDDTERLAGVAVLHEMVDVHRSEPVIVAGDLNTTPDSRVVAALSEFLSNVCSGPSAEAFSFPADKPGTRIDYIFYGRAGKLHGQSCTIVDEPVASDHRPLLANIQVD